MVEVEVQLFMKVLSVFKFMEFMKVNDEEDDFDVLMVEVEVEGVFFKFVFEIQKEVGVKKDISFDDDEVVMVEMDGLW